MYINTHTYINTHELTEEEEEEEDTGAVVVKV
jgi:hypothetical protein